MASITTAPIIASSTKGFEDAVNEGVSRAGKTLRGITGIHVVSMKAAVEDGKISKISNTPIEPPDDATVIEGGNRILTPGFIDLHVHFSFQTPIEEKKAHATAVGAYSVGAAKHFLDHGFTSVRDAGGTHPDLARAFNSGSLYGPRMFPSGAIISQTSGHGDMRLRHEPNPAHTAEPATELTQSWAGSPDRGLGVLQTDRPKKKHETLAQAP